MIPTDILVQIVRLVEKYGGDAVIAMISKLYSGYTEVSLEDLKALDGKFKDPRSYFHTENKEDPQIELKE